MDGNEAVVIHGSISLLIVSPADFIKTCQIYNMTEEEFVTCSTESVQGLFENIYKGNSNLQNVPVDPMRLNRIRILTGNGPVSVNASLSKVMITGFRNTQVTRSW